MSLLLMGVAFSLLIAGCQLRLSVDVSIERDGSGSLAVALAADAELRRQTTAAGVRPLDDLAAAGRSLADQGWSVSDETSEAGSREVVLSTTFADAAELERVSADLSAALDAPEVSLLEPLQLELTEDRVRLAGAASLEPTAAVSDLGLDAQEVVATVRGADALRYRIEVEMPGEVLETTAEDLSGTTAIWTLQPGERAELAVVSVRPSTPWLRIAGAAVAALVVVGAAGWALVRRRRSRARLQPRSGDAGVPP